MPCFFKKVVPADNLHGDFLLLTKVGSSGGYNRPVYNNSLYPKLSQHQYTFILNEQLVTFEQQQHCTCNSNNEPTIAIICLRSAHPVCVLAEWVARQCMFCNEKHED